MAPLANPSVPSGAYFALTRLFLRANGKEGSISENHWAEACLVGSLIYFVGYSAALGVVLGTGLSKVVEITLAVALFVVMWLIWPVELYLNSLIIRAVRGMGFWRCTPDRQAQSFLLMVSTSAMAFSLVRSAAWIHWVGLFWFLLMVLNCIAAGILTLKVTPEGL